MQPFTAAMLRVREAFYAAIVKSLLRTKSLLQTILNIWISPSSIVKEETVDAGGKSDQKKVKDFMDGVEREFRGRTRTSNLVALSEGLREEFYESLLENPQCMLPSYIHQLPTGRESGTYMALDVGGSTFRVALVELTGLKNGAQKARILELTSFKIGHAERLLKGVAFFDWMADRIGETLSKQKEGQDLSEAPLSVGLSWSFAIE
jgi:hexokinase